MPICNSSRVQAWRWIEAVDGQLTGLDHKYTLQV